MTERIQQADEQLARTTRLSLKNEHQCFAFLGNYALSPPRAIDEVQLDFSSADYFAGLANVFVTLDIKTHGYDEHVPLLGFDQHFLEAFIRAYVMAATMGRLQILNLGPEDGLLQVRDFVTRQSIAECEHPKRMLLSPYLNGVLCSLVFEPHNVREERPLFQLPRSYKFLRSFTEMTHEALGILNKTLEKMRRKEPV